MPASKVVGVLKRIARDVMKIQVVVAKRTITARKILYTMRIGFRKPELLSHDATQPNVVHG